MTQDFDPKPREAMAEIKAICDRHQIAYACILSNRTHAEYCLDFPEWSLIQIEGNGIRFQTKKSDQDLTDSSFHLFYSIRDVCGMLFFAFQQAAEAVEKEVHVDLRCERR